MEVGDFIVFYLVLLAIMTLYIVVACGFFAVLYCGVQKKVALKISLFVVGLFWIFYLGTGAYLWGKKQAEEVKFEYQLALLKSGALPYN
jgi:hypothetical protein